MRKWKIEKKYINIAVLALAVILVASIFNNVLEQGTKYKEFSTMVTNTLFPVVSGFVLGYLLNPMLKFLEKHLFMHLAKMVYRKPGQERKQRKLSRILGVIATMSLFLVFLAGGFCMVIPQVYASVIKIIEDMPGYYLELEGLVLSYLEGGNEVSRNVLGMLDSGYDRLIEYVNTVILPNMYEIVRKITTGIIGGLKTVLNGVLAIIISIYVLFEKERLISYGKKLTYAYLNVKHANALVSGIRYVDKVFGGFINGKIIDSFIIGLICYVFMLITGFEYAVLISIIVGVTNVIPYFGPFIGAVPCTLLLLMAEPRQGLIFAVFILVLQQLDGNVIGPLILGDRLKLSSMWILIAILIGGGFFGVAGMILGVPTLACIYALLSDDSRKRLKEKELPTESEDYLLLDRVKPDKEPDGPARPDGSGQENKDRENKD